MQHIEAYLMINAEGEYVIGSDPEEVQEKFLDDGYSVHTVVTHTICVKVPIPREARSTFLTLQGPGEPLALVAEEDKE